MFTGGGAGSGQALLSTEPGFALLPNEESFAQWEGGVPIGHYRKPDASRCWQLVGSRLAPRTETSDGFVDVDKLLEKLQILFSHCSL